MVRPGQPWERPARGAADLDVSGDDRVLARWVAASPGALVRFRPTAASDVARAIGLEPGVEPVGALELPLDALRLADGTVACNMVVLGTPPDRLGRFARRTDVQVVVDGDEWFAGRATTIVIASGQFLRGLDIVPRGHPGDGRAEIQVYRLRSGEQAPMRARLVTGTHLPHPRILQRRGRSIEVRAGSPLSFEVDGEARASLVRTTIELLPEAFRVLI